MKTTTISGKIIIMIVTAALALLLVGLIGLYAEKKQSESLDDITQRHMQAAGILAEVALNITEIRLFLFGHLMNEESAARQVAEKKLEDNAKKAKSLLQEFEKFATTDSARQ